jgi:hypothetical protein
MKQQPLKEFIDKFMAINLKFSNDYKISKNKFADGVELQEAQKVKNDE